MLLPPQVTCGATLLRTGFRFPKGHGLPRESCVQQFRPYALCAAHRQDNGNSSGVAMRPGPEARVTPKLLLDLLQNLTRGVRARASRQSGPGMRATATKIEVVDRRAVARPVEQWPHREKLIERQIAMEDLSAAQSIDIFQILRRDDLVRQDHLGEIRSVPCQRLYNSLSERLSLALPIGLKLVRRVLHVDRHHVLTFGGERGIGKRGDRNLKVRLMREISVLGFVEGALEIVDLWPDMDASLERTGVAVFQPGEIRQAGERQVNFCDRTIAPVVP